MAEVVICRDCEHYERIEGVRNTVDGVSHVCKRAATTRVNVVTGVVYRLGDLECESERANELSVRSERCGPKGRYFRARGGQ